MIQMDIHGGSFMVAIRYQRCSLKNSVLYVCTYPPGN